LITLIGSAGGGAAAIMVWTRAVHESRRIIVSAALDLLRIISRLLSIRARSVYA
jgi:hypothetical protein